MKLAAMMVELNDIPVEPPDGQALTPEQVDRKKKKKRDKLRSAWISFVGRIVAQIMGAAATICVGLMLVQKYQLAGPSGTPTAPVQESAPMVVPIRLATPGEPSVAVLPLENFSLDWEESFADGMTEALITGLSRFDEIRVISRTSSMRYKKQRRLLPEIARELGVDFIIEGSVTKVDRRVRITAQLIDARSDEHLWVDTYERPLREVLSLQATVATAIARSVKGAIVAGPRGPRSVVSRRTVDPQPVLLDRQ
jgi:TolB-like protein